MDYHILKFKDVPAGKKIRYRKKWLIKYQNNLCTNCDPITQSLHIVKDEERVGIESS